MDIDEIKCSLCGLVYDEKERIPILLPDCGHSFCLSCINECFQGLQQLQISVVDVEIQESEEINQDIDLCLKDEKMKENQQIIFRCPEDDIECSIQKPDQLPKNYALLKIVKKTKECELMKNKKLIQFDFIQNENKFVANGREEECLTKYLTKIQSNQKAMSPIKKKEFSSEQKDLIVKPPSPISEVPQLELCSLHKRPLELICVDDKHRICTQCALFGNHKGHDVREEDEVTKEISLKVEVLMEMYQAMEQQCDELGNPENYDKKYNIFKNIQNDMKGKIQDQFKVWRKCLRAMEMQVIDSLYGNFTQFEDKFHLAFKQNNVLIGEAQHWMDKAKQQLDDYSVKTSLNPHFIPFDMIDGKHQSVADEILNMGEHLLDKAERKKNFPSLNGLENHYSQVKLQFDPSFEKRLIGIAKVTSKSQYDSGTDMTTASASFLPPFSFNDEEEVTQNMSQPLNTESGLNLSNISFNEFSSPINETISTQKQIEEQKQSHLKQDETMMSNTSSELHTSSHSANQTEQISKENFSNIKRISSLNPSQIKTLNIKKKSDLATTFKNDAINGELDLSNKNLSDMHVNELAKCIRGNSSHIRTLNLSKNKLSDEGINHIMKALCDCQIEIVNLQNNKLTEKCVETMVGILKTNKNLRVLDLQNNGIQSRLMKNKLKNSLTQMEVVI